MSLEHFIGFIFIECLKMCSDLVHFDNGISVFLDSAALKIYVED